jgi:hypothetical protein
MIKKAKTSVSEAYEVDFSGFGIYSLFAQLHLPSTTYRFFPFLSVVFSDILLSFAATQRAFNQTETLSIDLTEIISYHLCASTSV